MLQLGTIAAAVASAYRPDEAGQAATWVTTYLVTVGVLGALGWLGTVWAHRRGRRWAWSLAVTLLVLGTALAVTNLTISTAHSWCRRGSGWWDWRRRSRGWWR
ncbi:hypothetical protein ACFWQL_26245 [Amycolatopsis thermoflava]|uniref:hypothetical protein n=1 Tax=Amycolatopsis thermoflava TaxID=84480 RepID=UPI0036554AB1